MPRVRSFQSRFLRCSSNERGKPTYTQDEQQSRVNDACRGGRLSWLPLATTQVTSTASFSRKIRWASGMDWATDLEITSKKLLPRLGRRSTQNVTQEDLKSDDDLLDSPISASSAKQPPAVPPRTRKTGWGEELKSGRSRGAANIIEQERSRGVEKDEPVDDIPVIPDLDEIQEDSALADINTTTVNVNRVAAYKELDTDLIKNAAFTSLNGVNLSLLAEKLYTENLTKDSDEVWNWNLLFTQVSSEINSETQKKIPA
ncbi:intraflagellar transport 43 isoform X2 [Ptiloglossa arizonensis]|uniref:intraflagellar transport 43 isoform X2 n=1 Tax=Ptiloglossa arizonensis TaxID=3350558 RepID=UPI003FA06E3A